MYGSDIPSGMPLGSDLHSITVGTPVTTRDGEQLGIVSEQRSDSLLVRGVEHGADITYVVIPVDIAHIEPDGVRLLISRAEAMREQARGIAHGPTTQGDLARGATPHDDMPPA